MFWGCLGRRAFLLLSDRYKYSSRFCLKSENNYSHFNQQDAPCSASSCKGLLEGSSSTFSRAEMQDVCCGGCSCYSFRCVGNRQTFRVDYCKSANTCIFKRSCPDIYASNSSSSNLCQVFLKVNVNNCKIQDLWQIVF